MMFGDGDAIEQPLRKIVGESDCSCNRNFRPQNGRSWSWFLNPIITDLINWISWLWY